MLIPRRSSVAVRFSTGSVRLKIRWPELLLTLAVMIVVFGFTVMGLESMDSSHGTSLPRCTDSIADSGGSCHGEPLPPCVHEDSDDCYWDAPNRGNGLGRSFIVEHGVVQFLDEGR